MDQVTAMERKLPAVRKVEVITSNKVAPIAIEDTTKLEQPSNLVAKNLKLPLKHSLHNEIDSARAIDEPRMSALEKPAVMEGLQYNTQDKKIPENKEKTDILVAPCPKHTSLKNRIANMKLNLSYANEIKRINSLSVGGSPSQVKGSESKRSAQKQTIFGKIQSQSKNSNEDSDKFLIQEDQSPHSPNPKSPNFFLPDSLENSPTRLAELHAFEGEKSPLSKRFGNTFSRRSKCLLQ